jgi:hypothetical protein
MWFYNKLITYLHNKNLKEQSELINSIDCLTNSIANLEIAVDNYKKAIDDYNSYKETIIRSDDRIYLSFINDE